MLSKILALSTILYVLVPQSTWAQSIVCTLGPQMAPNNKKCARDIDCQGDWICDSGKCVPP